jgi:hypothetical protein
MKTTKLFLSPLRRAKSRRDGTLLTVCFSLRAIALLFFSCVSLHAQVTIGGLENPKAGAILDLNSSTKGGLILSNVTIANLEKIPVGSGVFSGVTEVEENLTLRGTMVYNTGQGTSVPAGIYIWNGYCWTKDGGDKTVVAPSITVNNSAVDAFTIAAGAPATFAVVSPQPDVTYEWFVNTSPYYTTGADSKGTGNSYTTPLSEGTYYYYCTAISNSCPSFNAVSGLIRVTVFNTVISAGSGTLSGTTCFDVVRINNGYGCGSLSARDSQKYTFADTPTQTYTFTPSGAPGDLAFGYTNLNSSNVIQSISQNENDVTVTFNTDLDTRAAGLTRAGALKAELYAVFTDGGTQTQVKLTLSVADCQCCPGVLIEGGTHYPNIGDNITAKDPAYPVQKAIADNTSYADLLKPDATVPFVKLSTKDLCVYYRDAVNESTTKFPYLDNNIGSPGTYNISPENAPKYAVSLCGTDVGVDANDRSGGAWRLPNIAELGQMSTAATGGAPKFNALSSATGADFRTTNILNNDAYFSSTEYDTGYVNNNRAIGWQFSSTGTYYSNKYDSRYVRCVRTID